MKPTNVDTTANPSILRTRISIWHSMHRRHRPTPVETYATPHVIRTEDPWALLLPPGSMLPCPKYGGKCLGSQAVRALTPREARMRGQGPHRVRNPYDVVA